MLIYFRLHCTLFLELQTHSNEIPFHTMPNVEILFSNKFNITEAISMNLVGALRILSGELTLTNIRRVCKQINALCAPKIHSVGVECFKISSGYLRCDDDAQTY